MRVAKIFLGLTFALVAAACAAQPKNVTAYQHGPMTTVVIEYSQAISSSSVSPDAFTVSGAKVMKVFVTDNPQVATVKDSTTRESIGKDGQYVVVSAIKDGAQMGQKGKGPGMGPKGEGKRPEGAPKGAPDGEKFHGPKYTEVTGADMPSIQVQQIGSIKTVSGSEIAEWDNLMTASKVFVAEHKAPKGDTAK
jgi:hypothetical protein